MKLIFTDLDGSLLDHHTYSFAPAANYLDRLETQGIPVIPITSKTRAEVLVLRRSSITCIHLLSKMALLSAYPRTTLPSALSQQLSLRITG
jgi:predicted mannosyl-3-phosphoglycerate phosphatase (HAD superfamily)